MHDMHPGQSDMAAKLASIRHALKNYVAGGVVGISCALSFRDEKILTAAAGVGDVDSCVPLDQEHTFRIASCTKIIVAAAILRLAQNGFLDIDETIDRWVPFIPQSDAISVRMLLNHTSGLPGSPKMPLRSNQVWSPKEIIEFALSTEVQHPPGIEFRYSNTGYVVARMLIEEVSGRSYSDYLHESFFTPFGMTRSYVGSSEDYPRSQHARGYIHDENTPNPIWNIGEIEPDSAGRVDTTEWFHLSLAAGAGDLVSTPKDMARFIRALMDGEVLDERRLREMCFNLRSASFDGVPVVACGHGSFILREDNVTMNGHFGHMPGYTSLLTWHHPTGISLACFQNSGALDRRSKFMAGINELTARIWEILLADDMPMFNPNGRVILG
jgi:D-alanyl-D-alanine carboxypeptidase